MKTVKESFLVFLFLLIVISFSNAQIIHVPGDYATIQQGINAAINGDTVLVDTGIYYENVKFHGKSITVASNFILTLDTSYISNTIIDGNNWNSVVRFENGEDSTSILNGFSIQNGYNDEGGGIRCTNSSPSVKNSIIRDNRAFVPQYYSYGGGIYCYHGSPYFENLIIQNNSSLYGGGIYLAGSSPVMINSIIEENVSTYLGGGLGCYEASPLLVNVCIANNTASYGGGGFYSDSSDPVFEFVTIRFNYAKYEGGGISCQNSTLTFDSINRCNIYSNISFDGNDIFSDLALNICLDTFSVMVPTEFHAYPPENFTFDILHGKYQQISTDVYVSPAGDNSNSGLSNDEPFKTIRHAQTVILPDTSNRRIIHLMEGTYSLAQNGEILPVKLLDYIDLEARWDKKAVLDAEYQSNVIYAKDINSASINGLIIKNGSAPYGGGIHCTNSNLKITSTIISDNRCSAHGGGIAATYSTLDFINVLITNNISGEDNNNGNAGGMQANSCFIRFTNGNICDNTADAAGALFLIASNFIITNSIIWNNEPAEIILWEPGGMNVIKYTDIEEGWDGIGNINLDPEFTMEGENPYALEEDSPCIDTGTPDTYGLDLPYWDISGNYRIWDGNADNIAVIDLGAYEYGSVGVGIDNHEVFNRQSSVVCYPNPFSDFMNIEYELFKDGMVTLVINNYLGQEVCTLVNELQPRGKHLVQLDAEDLNCGIYFFRLSGNCVPVHQMILKVKP